MLTSAHYHLACPLVKVPNVVRRKGAKKELHKINNHYDTKEQSNMEKSLQLVFKNAAGSTKIITISNPKENLTKAETDAAMQKIVAANVFNTIGGDLVQAVEARVVNRNVQVLA